MCDRDQAYSIPEEFNRALSLLIQRIGQSPVYQDDAYYLGLIRNCLDIQYTHSDEDLKGAEGVFAFNRDSTRNRLNILVSPRYQVKDDLLTAILLSHEVNHALIGALGGSNVVSCYNDEAIAFANQQKFFDTLNQEEKRSITNRYGSSQEVSDLIDTLNAINKYQDEHQTDRALKYVKNNPYYKKECSL